MKLFLHINAKKIETVISYFDNYLWNVGIQKIFYQAEKRHLFKGAYMLFE